MPRYAYDRLTALDYSFLLLEKPNSYMHVGSTFVFDAGPLRRPEGGVDLEAVRSATEALLPRIPRYRQKLKYIPVENHPVWVDDDRFNLDYHLRHTALPKPGTIAQLKALSARILQQHLDRSRPLWEMWLVEGLEGDRFALISKVHHCMIDGVSGVDLMNVQLKTTPDREIPEVLPYFPRPAPSGIELFRHELLRRAALPFAAFRDVRDFMREAGDTRLALAVRLRAVAETLGTTLRRPSDTPLNRPIGPHRRFDWMAMDLADVKAVRKAFDGSLNDVVLATVAGALRTFLENRRVNVDVLDIRASIPVSIRTDQQRGTLGNQIALWMTDLPVAERDPSRRLAKVREATARLKESRQTLGAQVLAAVSEWTSTTLLSLAVRLSTRSRPFNLVVTNVPGPQIPLYLLGAELRQCYPMLALLQNQALGVALFSYAGRLNWGFIADWDLIPDLHDFVLAIESSFRELQAAAGVDLAAATPA
jgi:WS/DGAT/MGAT family acyltransferase